MIVDRELKAGRKTLKTLPGALLLGPTGARLWADYLEAEPGFAGRFDFIHKLNIPLLYKVTEAGRPFRFETGNSVWYPSHLDMTYEDERLSYKETKFITWDDCAVSCQTWTNKDDRVLELRLQTDGSFHPNERGDLSGGFDIPHYSFDMDAAIVVSAPELLQGFRLQPGETRTFIIAAALGIRGIDTASRLEERARAYADENREPQDVVSEHGRSYQEWFEKAPVFTSSDPVLNKTWIYRWFVLRHNLADPRYGLLQHPLFYEGRSHKKSKSPFGKGGWEFSKLINLSVPLHVTDARWYHDPSVSEGALQNMDACPDETGMFCCLMVDERLHSFANFSCWAAYRLYLIHRNKEVMKALLPGLKAQISSWSSVYGNENDKLMTEYRHTRTGKEYQPSYWYFHNYPQNPKDPETYTHVKRVDRTVYHYLNTLGVAELCAELGDPEENDYRELADSIKSDIIHKMWDEASQFFYDLHYQTDEKALVKNIVGFYPAWAEIVDERHDGLTGHLLNPKEFRTKCPFPSVSADNPAYAKEGGWFGDFIKGRNGCMWNGPTWPYTNAVALDALARESKRQGHAFDEQFAYFLKEYSYLHFQDRDLSRPALVEHYNSGTGEPLSDEQEYNHSYYIDLIISHVAGLEVGRDRMVLDPLDIGLDYFVLDRIRAADLTLRITYGKHGLSRYPHGIEPGYRVYVDNQLAFAADGLTRAELPLTH